MDVAAKLIKHCKGMTKEQIDEATITNFEETIKKLTGMSPSEIGGMITWVGIWRRFNRHFGLTDTGLY